MAKGTKRRGAAAKPASAPKKVQTGESSSAAVISDNESDVVQPTNGADGADDEMSEPTSLAALGLVSDDDNECPGYIEEPESDEDVDLNAPLEVRKSQMGQMSLVEVADMFLAINGLAPDEIDQTDSALVDLDLDAEEPRLVHAQYLEAWENTQSTFLDWQAERLPNRAAEVTTPAQMRDFMQLDSVSVPDLGLLPRVVSVARLAAPTVSRAKFVALFPLLEHAERMQVIDALVESERFMEHMDARWIAYKRVAAHKLRRDVGLLVIEWDDQDEVVAAAAAAAAVTAANAAAPAPPPETFADAARAPAGRQRRVPASPVISPRPKVVGVALSPDRSAVLDILDADPVTFASPGSILKQDCSSSCTRETGVYAALPTVGDEDSAEMYLRLGCPPGISKIWQALKREVKPFRQSDSEKPFAQWLKDWKRQCRRHDLESPQIWRMAMDYMPEHPIGAAVLRHVMSLGFKGFTFVTWETFVASMVVGYDSTLSAVHDLREFTASHRETVPSFLDRFEAARARAALSTGNLSRGISTHEAFDCLEAAVLRSAQELPRWSKYCWADWSTDAHIRITSYGVNIPVTNAQVDELIEEVMSDLIRKFRAADAARRDSAARFAGRSPAKVIKVGGKFAPYVPSVHVAVIEPVPKSVFVPTAKPKYPALKPMLPAVPGPPAVRMRVPAAFDRLADPRTAGMYSHKTQRGTPYNVQRNTRGSGLGYGFAAVRQCAVFRGLVSVDEAISTPKNVCVLCGSAACAYERCRALPEDLRQDFAADVRELNTAFRAARDQHAQPARGVHFDRAANQSGQVSLPVMFVSSATLVPQVQLDATCHSDLETLDVAAQQRHVVVDVQPEDMRYALSQLARAHAQAPLSTSSAVFVIRQHAHRKQWQPYLASYTKADSVLVPDSTGSDKWVDIYRRHAGSRIRGTKHVDQLRDANDVVVMHAADAPLGQRLYTTFDLSIAHVVGTTLIDSGAGLNVMTVEAARARGCKIGASRTSVTGVGCNEEPTAGCTRAVVQLGSRSVETIFDVVHALPGGLDAIIGQEFMRAHAGCLRFSTTSVAFECVITGESVCISRPYVEPASQSCPDRNAVDALSCREAKHMQKLGMLYQLTLNEVKEHELPPPPTVRLPRGEVQVIVRDFKVQKVIPEALQPAVDKYSDTVLSGKPPDGNHCREYAATIDLLPGATPRMLRAYRLTPKEREELETQVAKLLAKGWIRPSNSAWGAPVLFAPKSDGGLRMCVDYRMLNAATQKLNYPMPHIQEALDSFNGATVFTTLDLVAGFHQISVAEQDRHKTAFRTSDGLFEYTVMPMGLANAPAIFQRAMNQALGKYTGLKGFVRVYMDDIIIFSRNMDEHAGHVEAVLAALEAEGYCCRPDKCVFGADSVPYLGHVVSADGLSVDPLKVGLVRDWPAPTDVNQVRSFVGLVQYFRRFIKDLATHLGPLTNLTKKDVPFAWDAACQSAFDHVKAALVSAPVLAMPDVCKAFQMYTDASVFGCGGILMQDGRVVAYCGKKFTSTQHNWTTTEQELYALVYSLETWRCYLEGAAVELYTDHQPLIWLATQPQLSRKQTRWVIFLQRFDVTLKYVPGEVNPADPVSRAPHLAEAVTATDLLEQYDDICAFMTCRSSLVPPAVQLVCMQTAQFHRSGRIAAKEGRRCEPQAAAQTLDSDISSMPQPAAESVPATRTPYVPDDIWNLRRLARGGIDPKELRAQLPVALGEMQFGQSQVSEGSAPLPAVTADGLVSEQADALGEQELRMDKFLEAVRAGYLQDEWFGKAENTKVLERVGDYWFHEHALVLPNHQDVRRAALFQVHDAPWAGHVGRERTRLALRMAYWWPAMDIDVRTYVQECDKCQRNKTHHQIKENFLVPLPVPERPWSIIGVDFITQLPVTLRGFDAITVFVCHFSKMVHLVPCHSNITSAEFADLYRRQCFRLHGVQEHIVSDRGTQFVAGFWEQFCKDVGVRLRMSSAYQPSTDGLVERHNKVVEEMLRSYVDAAHQNWDTILDTAEFAVNKAMNGKSCPFELVFHHVPLSPPESELFQNLPTGKGSGSKSARKYGAEWTSRYTWAKQLLWAAKDRMKVSADQKRAYRSFVVGDYVMVSSKNMALKKPHPAKKFCPLFVGPFEVLARVGMSAYRLRLPERCRMHPVFHVSKCWQYNQSSTHPRVHEPILEEDSGLFEVQDILNKRGPAQAPHYLVQWKGYDQMYNTWEPSDSLSMCSDLVKAYERRGATTVTPAACFVSVARQHLPAPPVRLSGGVILA